MILILLWQCLDCIWDDYKFAFFFSIFGSAPDSTCETVMSQSHASWETLSFTPTDSGAPQNRPRPTPRWVHSHKDRKRQRFHISILPDSENQVRCWDFWCCLLSLQQLWHGDFMTKLFCAAGSCLVTQQIIWLWGFVAQQLSGCV